MINHEVFFNGPLVTQFTGDGLPISIYEPPFAPYYKGEHSNPDHLTTDRVPDLASVLFQGNGVLEQTLTQLAGDQLIHTQLRTVTEHQSGRKGIIRIFVAATEDGHETPFITHTSRFPIGDKRSDYLHTEYTNLRLLADLFTEHLDEVTLQRYNVVKPIAYGISGELDGKRYPFFTMPYVSQGELHQNFLPVSYYPLTPAPFFMYAMPYTKEMSDLIAEQTRNADVAEGVEVHQRLSRDFLIWNGIAYYVFEKRMLNNMRINAGDWMAEIDPESGMKLTLTAIQDGFTEPVSEAAWVKSMKDHQERCEFAIFGQEDTVKSVWTFFNWQDSFFYDCLKEAQTLVHQ